MPFSQRWVVSMVALLLVVGCQEDRSARLGKMEPMVAPGGAAAVQPAQVPAESGPAPEPEPEIGPVEAAPAPLPPGTVRLRWRLPQERKMAFRAWMGQIPPQTDLGPALQADKLIAAGELPKPLAARLAGLAPSAQANLTAILAPAYGDSLTIRMLSNDLEIPADLDPAMAQRLVATGGGTVLRGEISGRGKALSASDAEGYRVLALLFELPKAPVKQGDSWELEVDLLSGRDGLEPKQASKFNRAWLSSLTQAKAGGEVAILAILEILVAEQESGLAQSGADAPKPYERSAVFVGRGEFLVEAGRWNKFVGRLLQVDPGQREPRTLTAFSLVALPKVPDKFKEIE
jgi:hypothetical protein